MKPSTVIKIRYRDFWPGFRETDCLFTQLIEQISGVRVQIVFNPNEFVDLQFDSTFSLGSLIGKSLLRGKGAISKRAYDEYVSRSEFGFRTEKPTNARKFVWYTGENKRPPLKNYDACLSFDKTDQATNNLYFPYWMLRMNWGFSNSEYELSPTPIELSSKRLAVKRPFTACQFSGTGNPLRLRLAGTVSRYFELDSYGKHNGNRVDSKKTIANRYGFQVCSENDLYPGYVTEKLQESWITHNVPIWAGLHATNNFNENAYINLTGLDTAEIENRLISVSLEEMYFMQEQPLLTSLPDLTEVSNLLTDLL